jgi:predicted DNA-binding transcriptional regulator AlpA
MTAPRWLDMHAAAEYIGLAPDTFRRRVKAGTLPKPSAALGPRLLRWDRAALDAAMTPAAPSRRPLTGAVHAVQIQGTKATQAPLRR